MLRSAVPAGLATVRAAGWRPFALALLGYVPVVALDAGGIDALVLPAAVFQMVVVLALVRVLGAWRPGGIETPPQVDEEGRRVAPPPRPGPPLTDEDRWARVALRNALALWLPALRLFAILMLTVLTGLLTLFAITGGKVADASLDATSVALVPIVSLFQAFVVLAPQRVGLEGDPRVLVAVAHSVRIARTAYGLLFALAAAEPLATVPIELATGDDTTVAVKAAWAAGTIVVASVLHVVTTAIANEAYLRGPRLDLAVAEPA